MRISALRWITKDTVSVLMQKWIAQTFRMWTGPTYLWKGIQQLSNLSATDKAGRTALHVMAAWGYIEGAEALLAAGADPNARDHGQRTPLHEAVEEDFGSDSYGLNLRQ